MNRHWVAAWGVATSVADQAPAQYARDTTLRYLFRIGVEGSAVRLHLSNRSGEEEAVISRVTLRNADGVQAEVTFGGEAVCCMAAHGKAVSDAIALPIRPGTDVAVSLYLKDFTPMHTGCACTGPFFCGAFARGDRCDEPEFDLRWQKTTDWCYFLTEADVLATENVHAFVAFGDSITAAEWPDQLAARLTDMGRTDLTVVRRAIPGNRMLREYSHLQHLHHGPAGLKRFEEEIAVPGAASVLILHGVNDIIHPDGQHPCRPMDHLPAVDELIAGMRRYIAIARAHGLKVYAGTLTPIHGYRTADSGRQAIRSAFNEWIRTTDEIDGYADFDAATHDPANPIMLLSECDCGDHLHPSLEGARRMAACIPEAYLKE